jgi:hypothetical protein
VQSLPADNYPPYKQLSVQMVGVCNFKPQDPALAIESLKDQKFDFTVYLGNTDNQTEKHKLNLNVFRSVSKEEYGYVQNNALDLIPTMCRPYNGDVVPDSYEANLMNLDNHSFCGFQVIKRNLRQKTGGKINDGRVIFDEIETGDYFLVYAYDLR